MCIRDRKKEARALTLPHARIDSLHAALQRAQDQRDRWAALTLSLIHI